MVHFTNLFTLFLPFVTFVTVSLLLNQVGAEATQHFSFARWVDDISTNPDTALSPEQAWQAYRDSPAIDTSPAAAGPEKRWDSQVQCTTGPWYPVWVPSVVACMFQLAGLGQQPCNKPPSTHKMTCEGEFKDKEVPVLCAYNGAYITPYSPNGPWISDPNGYTTCQGVAQTLGAILDTCVKDDKTLPNNTMVSGFRKTDLTGTKAGVAIVC